MYDTIVEDLLADQPAPVATEDSVIVTPDRVLALAPDGLMHREIIRRLLITRQDKGIETYGNALKTDNGREATADLVQELVDALYYATQRAIQTGDRFDTATVKALLVILDREIVQYAARR